MFSIERFIVKMGKQLPFIICFILLISFTETAYSFSNDIYVDGQLYKPISWFIGDIVRYDWLTVLAMLAFSYGFSNCWRNKVAIYYLIYNLMQKHIIENISINSTMICYYLIFNISILVILLFLGLQQGLKNMKHKTL